MYASFLRQVLTAAGVVLLAGAVVTVEAQQQQQQRRGGPGGRGGFTRGGFGGFGGGVGSDILRTAQAAEVQEHLKLSDEQKAYVGLLAEDVQEKDREFREGLRDTPRDQIFAKLRERQATRNKEVESQLADIIGKEKVTRLKQVQVQLQGVVALFSQEVRDELGISEEQQQQIGQAMQEATEEVQDIIRKKQEEKVRALLTADQKSKWDSMRGTPIDFKIERQRRPGGRFGGGNREGGGRRRRPGGDGDRT